MLLIVALVTNRVAAQVLPAPVFGEEPTKIKLVVKNVDDYPASFPHCVFFRTFHTDNGYPGVPMKCVLNSNKRLEYEADVVPGMTGHALVRMMFSQPDNTEITFRSGEIAIILVPGKTTTITYDGKKDSIKFEGPFSALNEEITRYVERNGKYSFENIIGLDYNDPSTINMTPEEMSKFAYKKYKETEQEIMQNKKISAEFKEWWRCYMAYNQPACISDYAYFYHEKHQEPTLSHLDEYHTWSGVSPFEGNGLFYLDLRMAAMDVRQIYLRSQGVLLAVNENVQRLCEAEQLKRQIEYHEYIAESKIAELCKGIPEYEPSIRKFWMEKETESDQDMDKPTLGKMCELDRSLEGEDILKSLIAKYQNGKPTVISISQTCYAGEISHYSRNVKDKINLVFIIGGKYADEMELQKDMRKHEGDFYYIMKYQYDYLSEHYKKADYKTLLLVSADGTEISNPTDMKDFVKKLNEMTEK